MKVLFTNKVLHHAAGTQVIVRDLAIALHRKGWQVAVFTNEAGRFAEEITRHGIIVTEQLQAIPFVPDVIHAHHYKPALEAINYFPETPAISFIHDRLAPIDMPPKHRNIVQYLAADYNVYDRLVRDARIPSSFVKVLLNWVDVSKFPLRTSWNELPKTALVFSNYATHDNFFLAIKEACSKVGITLDAIGSGMQNNVTDPGPLLCKYDIVFAKAKAAMEALATGASVIPCDKFGLGEMVVPGNYEHFRKYNFGMKILNKPILPRLISEEIRKYSIVHAASLAGRIRKDADFDLYVETLISYYDEAVLKFNHGFRTYKAAVRFHPLRYWIKRKLMSRKRELQKQIRRLKRRRQYGNH